MACLICWLVDCMLAKDHLSRENYNSKEDRQLLVKYHYITFTSWEFIHLAKVFFWTSSRSSETMKMKTKDLNNFEMYSRMEC